MNDQLDRNVSEWLSAGPSWDPEAGLDQALGTLRRVRQLPGWVAELTDGTLPRRRSTWLTDPAQAIVLALVLLALVGMIVAANLGRQLAESRFESQRYGFSIKVPDGWQVVPAEIQWGPRPFRGDDGRAWDILDGPEGSLLLIASAEVDARSVAADWAAASLGRHQEMNGTNGQERCTHNLGRRILFHQGEGVFDFQDGPRLDGQVAAVRAACGYVDAVVPVGDRMYVVVLDTMQETGADWELFNRLTASLELHPEMVRNFESSATPSARPAPATEPAPSPGPSLGPVFASRRYAYSVQYPAGWDVIPAEQGDVTADPLREGPKAYDQFVDPASGTVIWIFAQPIPIGVDVTTWAESRVPLRSAMEGQPDGHRHCVFRSPGRTMFMEKPWPVDVMPFEVGTASGLLRAACIYVDGIAIGAHRAVVVRIASPEPGPRFIDSPAADRARLALFYDVVSTLDFEHAAP